jgi:acetyl esterase/lipase
VNFDPEVAAVLDLMPDEVELSQLAEARAWLDRMVPQLPPDPRLEQRELHIPGFGDGPDVRILLFEPIERERPSPGIVYIHGGGFVLGSAETEAAGAASLAAELGAVVASVDYRLAPEHPYPAGLDDCYATLTWLAAQEELDVDPARIAVAGNSAGGGLSAALALRARDSGGPSLCFQFLGIPDLDDRLETPSMRDYVDTPMWSRPSAELSWNWYLGEDRTNVPPYASPGRAEDLAGLPPAYVSVAQFDPLRDEGIAYAQRMAHANVSVELHMFPGTFHGSMLATGAWISRRQNEEMITVLRRVFKLLAPS